MTNKTIMTLAVFTALSTTAFGANGKPFQALQTQIDSNSVLIANNSGAISALNKDIAGMKETIATIDTNIDTLKVAIANNTEDIAAAALRMTNNEGDIATLKSDLTALTLQHKNDLVTIEATFTQIEKELADLNTQRETLAKELNDKLAALRTEVSNNALAIDALVLDLVSINAQLTSINSSMLNETLRLNSLDAAQAEYETALATLTARVDALATRVSGLEALHAGTTCENNPLWQPVDCTTTDWVWSSDRAGSATLETADANQQLWASDSRHGSATSNTCSLDGTGWVSVEETTMAGCNESWYHIGGRFTGNCGGHDGDVVRRLTMSPEGCYDYTAE